MIRNSIKSDPSKHSLCVSIDELSEGKIRRSSSTISVKRGRVRSGLAQDIWLPLRWRDPRGIKRVAVDNDCDQDGHWANLSGVGD